MLALRTPSAMKDISISLPLTQLRDTNGNNLHLVSCTTDSEELKGKMGKEEYNLEDNFDRLCILDRDGDGQVLEEFGPGIKRTFSTQSQNAADERDEQSAKKRLQAPREQQPRPPPANTRQMRKRPEITAQYPQPAIDRMNATQPTPASTSVEYSSGGSPPSTSSRNINCERPVPVLVSDLSQEVEDDGASVYTEEDIRKILDIEHDLINSKPVCLYSFDGMGNAPDNLLSSLYSMEPERETGIQVVSGQPARNRPTSTTTVGEAVGPPVRRAGGGGGAFFLSEASFVSDSAGPYSNVSSRSGQMPTASYAVGPPQTNLSRFGPSGPPSFQTRQPLKPGPGMPDSPSTSKQQKTVQGMVTGPPTTGMLNMTARGPPTDPNQGLSPLSLHSRDSGLSGSNSSISSNGSEKNANSTAFSSSSSQQEAQKQDTSVSSDRQASCSHFSPGLSSPPGYPMHRSNSMCSNSSSSESRDSSSCMQEASPTGSFAQLSPKVTSPQTCPGVYQFPQTPESDRQSTSSVCQSPDWPRSGYASLRTPAPNGSPVVHGVISSPLQTGGHCISVQQQVVSSPEQVRSPANYGLVSLSSAQQGSGRGLPPTPNMTGSPGAQVQSSPKNPPISPSFSQQVRRSSPAQEGGFSPASLHSPQSNGNLTYSPQGQSPSSQDAFTTSPGPQVTRSPEQNRSPASVASASGPMAFSPPQTRSPSSTCHAQSPPDHRHNFPQTSQQSLSPNHQFVPVASVTYAPSRPPAQNLQIVSGNLSQSLLSACSHNQRALQSRSGSDVRQPSSLPAQTSQRSHHSPPQSLPLSRQSSLQNRCPAMSGTAENFPETRNDDEGDASDPGSGSESSPGSPDCYSRGSPSPDDILAVAFNERGEWVKDEHGDTFLHSLSAWDVDEDTVCRYLYLVKDKPHFSKAINEFNKTGEVPLFDAVCYGKIRLVHAFLSLGADVNRLCDYMNQRTCLHQAVEQREPRMVATLLGCPYINVDARRSCDGCTPLMVAMMNHTPFHPQRDCLEIIKLMVAREDKPDFTIRDMCSSKTVMMLAVETKDVRVLDLMLEEIGVDQARQLINMTNRAGDSAVHIAAGLRDERIKEQMLSKLIRAGGETTKKNHEGVIPKDWARTVIERVAVLK